MHLRGVLCWEENLILHKKTIKKKTELKLINSKNNRRRETYGKRVSEKLIDTHF